MIRKADKNVQTKGLKTETMDITPEDYRHALKKIYKEYVEKLRYKEDRYKDLSQTANVYALSKIDGSGRPVPANIEAYNSTIVERRELSIIIKFLRNEISFIEQFWEEKGFALSELQNSVKSKELHKVNDEEASKNKSDDAIQYDTIQYNAKSAEKKFTVSEEQKNTHKQIKEVRGTHIVGLESNGNVVNKNDDKDKASAARLLLKSEHRIHSRYGVYDKAEAQKPVETVEEEKEDDGESISYAMNTEPEQSTAMNNTSKQDDVLIHESNTEGNSILSLIEGTEGIEESEE